MPELEPEAILAQHRAKAQELCPQTQGFHEPEMIPVMMVDELLKQRTDDLTTIIRLAKNISNAMDSLLQNAVARKLVNSLTKDQA